MRTKIDIFSGFLGAGKTMLIKKLISEKLYDEKVVIIENEFGEVGIDGSILKKTKLQVKEITAGCICCSVAGDFKGAVNQAIADYNPERIIIEPSGVGKLSEVLNVFKSAEIKEKIELNMIVTVVDALKYNSYIKNFQEFYRNQITYARTIVLSRTQKLSNDSLEQINESLRSLNKTANIITTPWDVLKGERMVEVAERDMNISNMEFNLIKKQGDKFLLKNQSVHRHLAEETFETWGMETPKSFNEDRLKYILKSMEDEGVYGKVLRAKGIIKINDEKWVQFDYVPQEFQIQKTTPDYCGRLCVIGSGLKKDKIKELFSSY